MVMVGCAGKSGRGARGEKVVSVFINPGKENILKEGKKTHPTPKP